MGRAAFCPIFENQFLARCFSRRVHCVQRSARVARVHERDSLTRYFWCTEHISLLQSCTHTPLASGTVAHKWGGSLYVVFCRLRDLVGEFAQDIFCTRALPTDPGNLRALVTLFPAR